MEEEKQQEQPQEKGKSNRMEIAKEVLKIPATAVVTTISWDVYAKHQAERKEQANKADNPEKEEETLIGPEEENDQNAVIQDEGNRDSDGIDSKAAVEPAPIVHTDDIDYEIPIDNEEQTSEIVMNEVKPIIHDLPEPTLPEPSLIDEIRIDEINIEIADTDIASNKFPDDFIGNEIQQDLFG